MNVMYLARKSRGVTVDNENSLFKPFVIRIANRYVVAFW